LFSKRVFVLAKLLLVGAILAPGRRTVTAVSRVRGKSANAHFQNYYRVLNRAQWSSLEAGRILLSLLLDAFVPEGPVVMGIDETIERRRGECLSAKGIYRDPVRSSHTHAAGTHSWGRPGVGAALSDRACPLGAVLPSPRSSAAIIAGAGTKGAAAGTMLVADPSAGSGGR